MLVSAPIWFNGSANLGKSCSQAYSKLAVSWYQLALPGDTRPNHVCSTHLHPCNGLSRHIAKAMDEEPAIRNMQGLLRPELKSAILSLLPYSITQSEPNGQTQGQGILSCPRWEWTVMVKGKGAPRENDVQLRSVLYSTKESKNMFS